MKTKQFILFLILLCGISFGPSFSASAKVTDTKDIELEAKKRGENPRSLLPVRAWVEGHTVYITFADVPSSADVTLLNVSSGELRVETYVSPTTVCIPLNTFTTLAATYTIEISYGDNQFSGEFTIEE